jgi:hypothetical protein
MDYGKVLIGRVCFLPTKLAAKTEDNVRKRWHEVEGDGACRLRRRNV